MHASKLRFSQYLMAEFTATLHDGAEHLVVGAAGEENLASIELEQSTTNRPSIDGEVVGHAKN